MRQLHHGRAVEFGAVCGQPHLARVLNDGFGHFHFAVVKVAHGAVSLDAADADQANVHLELANEIHRGFTHNAAVHTTHHAAGDDDLAVGVVAQDLRHVQVVGDDAQAPVLAQLPRHRFHGGANVHDQRAAMRNRRGNGFGNAGFAIQGQGLALAVSDVFGGGTRHTHPAMKARQQACI